APAPASRSLWHTPRRNGGARARPSVNCHGPDGVDATPHCWRRDVDGLRNRSRASASRTPMVDPGLALLVFALIAAVALAVAWPRRGLAARIRRLARVSERVRIEDALKYLYHRGAAGDATHADALAGSLQIRPTRAR